MFDLFLLVGGLLWFRGFAVFVSARPHDRRVLPFVTNPSAYIFSPVLNSKSQPGHYSTLRLRLLIRNPLSAVCIRNHLPPQATEHPESSPTRTSKEPTPSVTPMSLRMRGGCSCCSETLVIRVGMGRMLPPRFPVVCTRSVLEGQAVCQSVVRLMAVADDREEN